jgi:preprotein translocase subunit YajC
VFISQAFAQTAPAAGGTESSLLSLLPLVLMFEALAKGDEVVIGGGVLGRVSKLGDSILTVEVSNGVELQVQRAAVVQVLPKGTFK